jgi:hypothetical protein
MGERESSLGVLVCKTKLAGAASLASEQQPPLRLDQHEWTRPVELGL